MFHQLILITGIFSFVFSLMCEQKNGFADSPKVIDEMVEASYGKATAPLTVVEFASLGCGHCATFHLETLPKLKKDYIDQGMIRLVFVDFPLSTPALAAAMIARCSGGGRYLGMVDVFFKSQEKWTRAEDPLVELKRVARFGGFSSQEVDTCLQKKDLLEAIQTTAQNAGEMYKVKSTPSFVINGKTYSGNLPYEKLKTIIDEELMRIKQ
jgi:protein-disulfide isomerase